MDHGTATVSIGDNLIQRYLFIREFWGEAVSF